MINVTKIKLTDKTVFCLKDDSESSCQGSVVEGQFEGSITTANGTFYIEPTDRYSTSNSDHHSIIYHEDDVGK